MKLLSVMHKFGMNDIEEKDEACEDKVEINNAEHNLSIITPFQDKILYI